MTAATTARKHHCDLPRDARGSPPEPDVPGAPGTGELAGAGAVHACHPLKPSAPERVPASRSDPAQAGTAGILCQMEAEIPRLRRFARAMVRDATLADDLVQECLERALSRLHLWQPGTNLRAWLFTILRNLHINGIRRQQAFIDIDAEGYAGTAAANGTQISRLELRDLRRALDLLPNEQREVVLLIGLEGISYAEAAQILAVSIGTVKSRLSRGRRALRLLMEGDMEWDPEALREHEAV